MPRVHSLPEMVDRSGGEHAAAAAMLEIVGCWDNDGQLVVGIVG